MLFVEHINTKNTLVLTAQFPEEHGDCKLIVNQDLIELRGNLGGYSVELPGLSMSGVTCGNLQAFPEDIISCTFSATRSKRTNQSRGILSAIERLLVDGASLLCKFCQNAIVKIEDVKAFKAYPPGFCLEDGLESDENYFCHTAHPQEQPLTRVSAQLPKASINSSSVTHSSGIHTGTEVIIDSSLLEAGLFKLQGGKYLHCSRCLMSVGQKVNIETHEHFALWTNCLDVLTEERDIDGDFLRYVEKPLLEEIDFYALFIKSLLENQCYRVILSAITWHGCVDFMLLWLIDQEFDLYNAVLPKFLPTGELPSQSDVTDPADSEQFQPAEQRTITMKLEPTACRRVFYRIVLPTSDASATESQRLLKTWRQDFGVTLFHLPWETCIGLASCLQQFTTRVAPQHRQPERHLSGFTCGAVPNLDQAT
ncbi:hypothetical protein PHET_07064 [Paragonimus heterotremus]|uniref:HECT-type E3 ubiquitin transferase E3D n=1 Tax=Paragonimus heterotremus TaxID=100268 RepID=A0A8J4SN84_9TREM|nr:hypothetical protein PHET_07064 [Paragonimus heterotremus]